MAIVTKYYTRSKKEPYQHAKLNMRYLTKYDGPKSPHLRSTWETKFALWLEKHPSVVSWSSETVYVYYDHPVYNRKARYFIDFKVTMKVRDGSTQTYLVEVKPAKFTRPPKKTPNMKPSTYKRLVETWLTNQAKWKAAIKYADKKGYIFKLATNENMFVNTKGRPRLR